MNELCQICNKGSLGPLSKVNVAADYYVVTLQNEVVGVCLFHATHFKQVSLLYQYRKDAEVEALKRSL